MAWDDRGPTAVGASSARGPAAPDGGATDALPRPRESSESAPRPDVVGRAALLQDAAYALVAIAMAVGALVSVLRAAAAGSVETTRLFNTNDDAFYYFTIAARWAAGEGSTFDGLQATNGYQPAWFWIVAAVFRATGGGAAAVVTVVALTAVLWLAAVLVMRALARELDAGWAGVVGAAAVAVVTYRTWFAGMEFALAGVAALTIVWLLVRAWRADRAGPTPRAAWTVGAVGAVAVLARLDLAALVAVVTVAVLVNGRRLAPAVRVAAPAGAVLAVYGAVNALLFATPVPTSGLAKQLGGGTPLVDALTEYATTTLGGPVRYLGVLVVAGVAVALVLAGRLPARGASAVRRVLLLLVAGQAIQLGYYAAASSWSLETWYYVLSVPIVFLVVLVVVRALPVPASARRTAGVAAVVLALLVVTERSVEMAAATVLPDQRVEPIAATVATARWANTSLPPDARLAMGDWAGAFGFAVDRDVLQTEGLVSSPEYLDALASGEGARYLADSGVGYVVKIGTRGLLEDEEGCSSYAEPVYGDGPVLRMRVCDADLVHVEPGPPSQGDVRVWRVTPGTFDDR